MKAKKEVLGGFFKEGSPNESPPSTSLSESTVRVRL